MPAHFGLLGNSLVEGDSALAERLPGRTALVSKC